MTKKMKQQDRIVFLTWYRKRITQYLERTNLTIEEAFLTIRSLPSSEARNKEIDNKVDDQYKVANRPDLLPAKLLM